MKHVWQVAKRELGAYFTTPLAYVFLVIFLFLSAACTFYMGGFFERGQADLAVFFNFHPWLYVLLVPALSMRLWAEERKMGTVELLLTLPVSLTACVLGKCLAAWLFVAVALICTLPLWITVSVLGHPDHGVIVASYLGSWLMAGGYLAVGAAVSAATRNQVIAFVVALVLCLLLLLMGFPLAQDVLRHVLPDGMLEWLASMSFLTHFVSISQGVLDARDVLYFLSLMASALYINILILELKKAD